MLPVTWQSLKVMLVELTKDDCTVMGSHDTKVDRRNAIPIPDEKWLLLPDKDILLHAKRNRLASWTGAAI